MAVTYLSGERIQGNNVSENTIMNTLTFSGSTNFGTTIGDSYKTRGEKINAADCALIGNTVSSVTVRIKDSTGNGLTGNLTCTILDSAGDAVSGDSFPAYNTAGLTSTEADITFINSNPTRVLADDDSIALYFNGDSTHLIGFERSDGADAFDGTKAGRAYRTGTSGALGVEDGEDQIMKINSREALDDKAAITNVPAGTRFEETDTLTIYRRKSGDGSAQNTNIWGSDYTWTVAGGAAVTTGNDPTGKIHLTQSGGSGNQEYGHTTLTSSANTKTFDFNFTFVRHVGDKANNSYVFLGSDNATPSASGGNGGSSAHGTNKRIKFGLSNGSDIILHVQDGDGSTGEGDSNEDDSMDMQGCTSCTESTETTRYYKILGNGTNVICHRWTTAALRAAWEANNSANTPESSSAAVNFTTNWLSRDALDTVSMLGHSGYHTGNWTVKEVSVKFDAGSVDSWVEKGTA